MQAGLEPERGRDALGERGRRRGGAERRRQATADPRVGVQRERGLARVSRRARLAHGDRRVPETRARVVRGGARGGERRAARCEATVGGVGGGGRAQRCRRRVVSQRARREARLRQRLRDVLAYAHGGRLRGGGPHGDASRFGARRLRGSHVLRSLALPPRHLSRPPRLLIRRVGVGRFVAVGRFFLRASLVPRAAHAHQHLSRDSFHHHRACGARIGGARLLGLGGVSRGSRRRLLGGVRFFRLEATRLARLERLQEPIALLTKVLGTGFIRARARPPRLDVFLSERRGVELSVGAELVSDVARARGDAARLRGARFRLRQSLVRGVQRSFRQGRAPRGLAQRVLGLSGGLRRRRGLALGAPRRAALRGGVLKGVRRAQAHRDGAARLAEPRARRRAEPREPTDSVRL